MGVSFLSRCLDGGAVADDLGQDVRLAQDQDLVGAELDLGAAVLGEDDLVTLLHVHLDVLPVLVAGAGADGEDLAALRLLPRRVGQHDAARGDVILVENLDDEPVTKGLQIHAMCLPKGLVDDSTTLALALGECRRPGYTTSGDRLAADDLSHMDSDLCRGGESPESGYATGVLRRGRGRPTHARSVVDGRRPAAAGPRSTAGLGAPEGADRPG